MDRPIVVQKNCCTLQNRSGERRPARLTPLEPIHALIAYSKVTKLTSHGLSTCIYIH